MATAFKICDVPFFLAGSTRSNQIAQPLEPRLQQFIKGVFWPRSRTSVAEYISYFKYFQWTVSIVAWSDGTVNGENFAIRTYGDLAEFARCMEQYKDCDRLNIAEKLRNELPSSTQSRILRSLDLTARLWLTLHVRSNDFPVGPCLSDITETQWTETVSLNNMIQDCCTSNFIPPSRQEMRIDTGFIVVKFRKLCRIKIQWTANLKDHLRYDQSKATLHICPHKICLASHLESCNILPKDLLAEIIRTLDLLFPFGHVSTREFLDKSGQTFYRTSSRDLSRPTDFGEFHLEEKTYGFVRRFRTGTTKCFADVA